MKNVQVSAEEVYDYIQNVEGLYLECEDVRDYHQALDLAAQALECYQAQCPTFVFPDAVDVADFIISQQED